MSKNSTGHVQKAVRRALIASDGQPVLTAELMRWAFPRQTTYRPNRYWSVHLAARRIAIKLGRCGKGNLWGPRPELLALIRDEDPDA